MRWIYGTLALALVLAAGIVISPKAPAVPPPPPHIVVHDVDEEAAWNETFTQVRYLAIQRDFAGLNALENMLRTTHAHTPSGIQRNYGDTGYNPQYSARRLPRLRSLTAKAKRRRTPGYDGA